MSYGALRRQAINDAYRRRYWNDPEYRAKKQRQARQRYEEDEPHRRAKMWRSRADHSAFMEWVYAHPETHETYKKARLDYQAAIRAAEGDIVAKFAGQRDQRKQQPESDTAEGVVFVQPER